MGFELSDAYINLYVEGANFFSQMDRVRASAQKAHAAMLSVGNVAKNMFLIGSAAMGFMVKKASDVEESVSKFNAVFKEQSKAAEDFAASLAGTINRSKYDLMGYMATLQDTFVPLGFARDEAARLSEKVTALAEDLASFNNQRTEDVVTSLQSALIGNTETVRKYGVVINEMALNQELLNMGIAGGTKSATEQEKALARLNIILRSTTDAQGDAARTSGSFANQVKGLQAKISEMSVTVGQTVIPALSNLITHISPVIQNVVIWAAANQETILTLSKVAAGIVAVTYVIPKIISGITMIINAVRGLIAVQSVLLSISGPAGWAALAGGVAIAATAIMGMDALMQNLTLSADETAKSNNKVAASFNNVAISSKAAAAGIAGVAKAAKEAGSDPLARLAEYADNLGLDKYQQVELELRKNNNYTDGAKKYLDYLRETITAKEKELELSERAKDVYEKTLTPLEQYNNEIARLNELLEKKLITQETYSRAKKQMDEDLAEATRDRKAEEEMQDAANRASRVFDETRTSLEKYKQKLSELEDLYKRGLIDQDTYGRAVKMAEADYNKSEEKNNIEMPSVRQLDRRIGFEGVSTAWNRLAASLVTKDAEKQKLDVAKKQVDEQKKANQHLDKIAKNTEKPSVAVVGP